MASFTRVHFVAWFVTSLILYALYLWWQASELRPRLSFPREQVRSLVEGGDAAAVAGELGEFARGVADRGFGVPTLVTASAHSQTATSAVVFNHDTATYASATWTHDGRPSPPKLVARSIAFVTRLADGRYVVTCQGPESFDYGPVARAIGIALPLDVDVARLPELHETHVQLEAARTPRAPLVGANDALSFLQRETQLFFDEQLASGAYRLDRATGVCTASFVTALRYLVLGHTFLGGLLRYERAKRMRDDLARLTRRSTPAAISDGR